MQKSENKSADPVASLESCSSQVLRFPAEPPIVRMYGFFLFIFFKKNIICLWEQTVDDFSQETSPV